MPEYTEGEVKQLYDMLEPLEREGKVSSASTFLLRIIQEPGFMDRLNAYPKDPVTYMYSAFRKPLSDMPLLINDRTWSHGEVYKITVGSVIARWRLQIGK